jgi:hypothetical protein
MVQVEIEHEKGIDDTDAGANFHNADDEERSAAPCKMILID